MKHRPCKVRHYLESKQYLKRGIIGVNAGGGDYKRDRDSILFKNASPVSLLEGGACLVLYTMRLTPWGAVV